jgi:uncharacterized membrane protein
MLIKFIVFGSLGWILEIAWTGFHSLVKKDYRMIGATSIWMFFIYGLAAFLEPICLALNRYPVLVRGGCYALCFFGVEYVTGTFLKSIHVCPWDYSDSRFNVQGIIRLDYAPIWFLAGLLFERVHFLLQISFL